MGPDYEVCCHFVVITMLTVYSQETLPSDTAGVRPGSSGLALMVVSYIDMLIQVQGHVTRISSFYHHHLMSGPGLQRSRAD